MHPASFAALGCGGTDHVAAIAHGEPPGCDVCALTLTRVHLQAEACDERGRITDTCDELTQLVADREGRYAEPLTRGLEKERECNFRAGATRSSTFEHAPMLVAIVMNANFSDGDAQ